MLKLLIKILGKIDMAFSFYKFIKKEGESNKKLD